MTQMDKIKRKYRERESIFSGFPSDSFNIESRYFRYQLKSRFSKNTNRTKIAQININSVRNKFDELGRGARGNIDFLIISETKLDTTFPTRQILIDGYISPSRLDRNDKGNGILVYDREDIPSKIIPVYFPNKEGFFLEISLREKK